MLVGSVVGYFLLGGANHGGFVQDFWQSLVRVLDASAFEQETAWPSRLVALVVTLLGIFIGGSLIGLIAAAIDQRVAELHKGRSTVLENRHTLILGWSARLPVIVQELVVANENVARPAIVILSPRPAADMEAEVRDRVPATKNTRIVCRTGDPTKPADLKLANVEDARSVIVLAGEDGDATVVKSILALKTLDPDFSRANVVAEFAHAAHAQTIRVLTDGVVKTVNSDDVIAEVTAQACHQAGLSTVFRELLDFAGDECYFAEVPELVGHTYGEALLAFKTSSLIGWCTADGLLELNPAPDTVFSPGDRVVAISEDDDTVVFTGFSALSASPRRSGAPSAGEGPIRVLIIGWSTFGPRVVEELEEFLPKGSSIHVYVDEDLVDVDEVRRSGGLHVTATSGGPENLSCDEGERFDHVIVLGYRGGLTTGEADARTLLTLLTLRKIWPLDAVPRVRIIAQLLDQANVELATATGGHDFIVSDALASLMLAQLSERPELDAVFDDLFDPDGAVIELRPASGFVPDSPVPYAQAVAAGIADNLSVIGWRREASGEVVVNPPKDQDIHLTASDQILVVGLRAAATAPAAPGRAAAPAAVRT
jgi:Trk K+ transport system NAD-binding subunit